MLEQLKQLWQVSFGDSPEYVEFYFDRAYHAENTITRQEDGKIVSAAQYRYFDIMCGSHILKGVYILGVCTHPNHRNKGLSGSILRQILDEQAKLGLDVAFLIPSEDYLFKFYEKFGFDGIFTAYEEHVSKNDTAIDAPYDIIKPSTEQLYEFYTEFYRSLDQAVIKDRNYFAFAMEDIANWSGRVDVCSTNGEIRGFAATEGDIVKELLCLDVRARNTLLSRLLTDVSREETKVIYPVNSPVVSPAARKITIGMARVLSAACLKDPYANLLLN